MDFVNSYLVFLISLPTIATSSNFIIHCYFFLCKLYICDNGLIFSFKVFMRTVYVQELAGI